MERPSNWEGEAQRNPGEKPVKLERCRHYNKCLRYTEMTLDWTALDCQNCPAYEKLNLLEAVKYWMVKSIGLGKREA